VIGTGWQVLYLFSLGSITGDQHLQHSALVEDENVFIQVEKQLKLAFKYAEANYKKSQQAQHNSTGNDLPFRKPPLFICSSLALYNGLNLDLVPLRLSSTGIIFFRGRGGWSKGRLSVNI